MKWGGGNAEFQLLATLPLKDTGTLNTRPGQGTFDLDDPRILVPGDPERSLVPYRMKKIGPGPDAARRLERGGREGGEAGRGVDQGDAEMTAASAAGWRGERR